MKLVAILGSPHHMKGTTAMLVNAFLDAAQEAGAETELLNVAKLNVAPCVACDVCHKVGKCPVKDDFQQVLDAMMGADAIVFASPNYIFSVSAQMKALFDRCCGPIHLMAFKGKYGAALVTSGGGGCEEVEEYILRFLSMMGAWTVGSAGAEAFRLLDPAQAPASLQEAADLGKAVVAAVAAGTEYPDQAAQLEGTAAFFRQLCEMQKDAWPYEHEVWQGQDA
jgi:multimeric flavodoxin WrbA